MNDQSMQATLGNDQVKSAAPDLYSHEMRHIMGHTPHWLIRLGTWMIIAGLGLGALVFYAFSEETYLLVEGKVQVTPDLVEVQFPFPITLQKGPEAQEKNLEQDEEIFTYTKARYPGKQAFSAPMQGTFVPLIHGPTGTVVAAHELIGVILPRAPDLQYHVQIPSGEIANLNLHQELTVFLMAGEGMEKKAMSGRVSFISPQPYNHFYRVSISFNEATDYPASLLSFSNHQQTWQGEIPVEKPGILNQVFSFF